MPSAAQTSKLVLLAAFVAVGITLAGCGGSKRAAPALTISPRDQWGTVWLCRPGIAGDPCTSDLATTVVTASGTKHVERALPASDPRVDCFYVYPTVSGQTTINANLDVGFRESEIAIAQVSRFSQVCRIYAPVYRQITLSALAHPSLITRAHALIAYRGVLAAFRDYLAHYNHGRGIVFIGHSQGATILIRLLQQEVDRKPSVRHRLVSALVLGGNVKVPKGRTVGGDFAHLPACTASREAGCVIAYSSFTGEPPKNSQFGRTTSDAGVNLLAPHNPAPNLRIMCVNPAAPAGGSAPLDPYIPALVLAFLPAGSAPAVKTPWVAFRGEYTAHCESSGNATWLQITHVAGSTGRSLLTRLRDPALGLHALDVNLALGNLVQLVRDEAAAYAG